MADIKSNSQRIRGTGQTNPQNVIISETFDEIDSRLSTLKSLISQAMAAASAGSGSSTPAVPPSQYNTINIVAGAAIPDYGPWGSPNQVTFTANTAIGVPIKSGGTITAGDEFELRIDQDATGGWAWAFDPIYRLGGFNHLAGYLNTFTVFRFRFDGTHWFLNITPIMDIDI